MSPQSSSPGAAPLPPLPNLSGSGGAPAGAAPGGQDGMAALMSGIAPIKMAVTQILTACQQIVKSGAIPGAEQPCGQIVALATSLLPMAAQQALQPMGAGGGASPLPPVGGGSPPPMQGS